MKKKELYADIIFPFSTTFQDYPDNESHAILIFFSGCDCFCKECYNPDLKQIENTFSIKMGIDEFIKEINKMSIKIKTTKLVFSGGNPLNYNNIDLVRRFTNRYKNIFDITIYTGYDINFVKSNNISFFKYIKTGMYDLTKKQQQVKKDNYMQLSSSNQAIYDSNFKLLTTNGKFIFEV